MALQKLLSRVSALNSIRYIKSLSYTFSILSPSSDLKVKHDRENLCFIMSLDSGAEHRDRAVLQYKYTGENEVNLLSTNVPESFRGRGVAATLSKAALDFVVDEKLRAHVSCWYIKKYVEENPVLGYKEHISGYC